MREEVKEYDYALRQIQYYLNNAKISYQRIKALLDVYKRIDETDFTDTPQTDDDEHEED